VIEQSFELLGVSIDVINKESVFARVENLYEKGISKFICVRDVHGVVLHSRNSDLADAHNNASLTVPDGKPLVWVGRLLGYKSIGQVCGRDLVKIVISRGIEKEWNHYFYGGAEGVSDKMVNNLKKEFQSANLYCSLTPPFRELTEFEINQLQVELKMFDIDVLWIGLGSPKQEIFIKNSMHKLDVPIIVGVGAAFDFIAGTRKICPKWIQKLGFEWMFRIFQEPLRLGSRYLKVVPVFIGRSLFEICIKKRFTNRYGAVKNL